VKARSVGRPGRAGYGSANGAIRIRGSSLSWLPAPVKPTVELLAVPASTDGTTGISRSGGEVGLMVAGAGVRLWSVVTESRASRVIGARCFDVGPRLSADSDMPSKYGRLRSRTSNVDRRSVQSKTTLAPSGVASDVQRLVTGAEHVGVVFAKWPPR